MNTEPSESRPVDGLRLERAIVLQLLRDDHEQRWSREELLAEIDAEAPALERALSRLGADGVLCVIETHAWASRAALRMDELGLIGV
jgi:2-keto-4-pentenoate hydratase